MDEEQTAAVEITLAYHRAWTDRDLDRAAQYIAEDVVCDSPTHGRLEGIEAFREYLNHLLEPMKSSEMQVALGNEETVLLWYVIDYMPPVMPAAEWITLRDGKVAHTRFVFDRLPFFTTVEKFSAFLDKVQAREAGASS